MSSTDDNVAVENGRTKGVTVVKPIIYGNVARYFGKKREDDGHTHQWTIYVKPYDNEDMSKWVKKVHFKLHDSYANSNRVVTCPPYEVSETGWGEFESTIRIYFEDPNEKPIVIYHILKLFQPDPAIMSGKKPLIHEVYDEIIFQDPSPSLYKALKTTKPLTSSIYKHETDFEARKRSTMDSVRNARSQIRSEIQEMKECLKESKVLLQTFREKMEDAGGSLTENG